MSVSEVWRITDYTSADEFYFCQEECADSFLPMHEGDFGDPEDVTEEKLEEAKEEVWKCDFCKQPIVK